MAGIVFSEPESLHAIGNFIITEMWSCFCGEARGTGPGTVSSRCSKEILSSWTGGHTDAGHARDVGQGNSGIYPALTVHANERISGDSGDAAEEYFDSTRVARRRQAGGPRDTAGVKGRRGPGVSSYYAKYAAGLPRAVRLHARDRSIYRTSRPPPGRSRVPRCPCQFITPLFFGPTGESNVITQRPCPFSGSIRYLGIAEKSTALNCGCMLRICVLMTDDRNYLCRIMLNTFNRALHSLTFLRDTQ